MENVPNWYKTVDIKTDPLSLYVYIKGLLFIKFTTANKPKCFKT